VRTVRLFCLALAAMLTVGACAAETGNTIHWMISGAPPKMIPYGPLAGKGYGQQQVAWLTAQLPNYEQRLEIVTPARLWYEMRTGKGVCSLDIVDLPEREQWAVFSRHQTSIPAYSVLVLKDRLPEFAPFLDADGRIDLDRLGATDRLFGLHVTGRYYMPRVNDFIDDPARKIRLDSMSASTRIFEMVANRRADFSFATGAEINYFTYLSTVPGPGGDSPPNLAMLPIKGGEEPIHGHFACSRDPLGRRMVEAVDRLLDEESKWREFLAPEQRWLDDVSPASR